MSVFGAIFSGRGKPAPQPDTRFGYAVVGLGRIAETFLEKIAGSPHVRVAAMVSGDLAKAERFARRFGAAHACTYADFDSLAERGDVHGVYIALPVTQHRAFTERAARAGKHVLCEKPMAPGAADCQAMIDACRAADVRLSIAYRCPYDAMHQRARDLLRGGVPDGGLGRVLRIDTQFGFRLEQGWRMQPAEGGSLYDVGIYPLNAIRYLLGEQPISVSDAVATTDDNGLEQAIRWTSSFASGAVAHCRSSYLERLPDSLQITCERGTLRLDPAFSHRARFRLQASYTGADGTPVRIDEQTPSDAVSQFRAEAEELAHAAAQKREPRTPGEDGLRDLEAIAAIYRAAGVPLP